MNDRASPSDSPLDLARRAKALATAVNDLSVEVRALDRKAWRQTLWIYTTVVALAISLVALTFVVRNSTRNTQTIARLEATVVRLDKSIKNQCGQLAIFLGSYRPESRPPDGREEYERAFKSMREQYADLDCDPEAIVPPMTTVPAPPR